MASSGLLSMSWMRLRPWVCFGDELLSIHFVCHVLLLDAELMVSRAGTCASLMAGGSDCMTELVMELCGWVRAQ